MDLMFARQPILDSKNKLYGYELLYREPGGNSFSGIDGDTATSSVVAAGFLSVGVKELSGGKKSFVNFTKKMLLNDVATLFPKDQIVVEILEDIDPTEDVLAACVNLKKEGYTIALDDFTYRPGYEAMIELADIIKVDFMLTKTERERRHIVRQFKNSKIRFLAEKVETHEDFRMAVDAGYTLFQGYYFSKPVIESTKAIPPAKMNHLSLIKALQSETPEFSEISKIIEKDVAFSYEILRIANTAYYYRGSKITSVKQAALRMGLEELRKWAMITVLRKIAGENQDAVVNLCAHRAKALELLSSKAGMTDRKTDFYSLGLFSMLDVLLGHPMELIVNEMALSDDVKELLLQHTHEGKMADCYNIIQSYEKGNWHDIDKLADHCRLSASDAAQAYVDAVIWASNFDM